MCVPICLYIHINRSRKLYTKNKKSYLWLKMITRDLLLNSYTSPLLNVLQGTAMGTDTPQQIFMKIFAVLKIALTVT